MKNEVSGVRDIFCFPSFPVAVACIKENPMTLAAVNFFSFNPPMVGIGIMDNRYSYELNKEVGEFTLNLPYVDQLDVTHYIGTVSGRDVDKFKETGLTPVKGKHVSSSWIKEFPVSMECTLFYIVNRRQRSVPTDLAYRHLQRMLWEKGTEWLYELEGRRGVQLGLATEVVDYLCDDKRSPWFQRIKRGAEPRREGHIIQDKKIIRSVTDVLKEKAFEGMQVSELADLLIDYWNAVASVYPVAFEDPRPYTLLGPPGSSSFTSCSHRSTRDARRAG